MGQTQGVYYPTKDELRLSNIRIHILQTYGPRSKAHWNDVINEGKQHTMNVVLLAPKFSKELKKKRVIDLFLYV